MGNGVTENLRKQLAVAVRSIQWSYIIFWSFSTSKEGVLNWGDGYYNGDIKTRKTFQTMELKPDKMGLQRSEQLKELYDSLLLEGESESETETELQSSNPSPALSPEDLTDAEWYYLVCMSFVFNLGQDLAGKALENNQTVWLSDAQYADSKVFSRSLLAKSASIQTIVCFPYLGGVIELGVTDLVLEDPSIVQHIKASLLDFSKPVCSEKCYSARNEDDDNDPLCPTVGCDDREDRISVQNIYNGNCDQIDELQENVHKKFDMDSPDDFSNGEPSQAQSWNFMDDDFCNDSVQVSMKSSGCISRVIVAQANVNNVNIRHLKELQECNDTKFSSIDLVMDEDLHYKRTVSTLLGASNYLGGNLSLQGCNYKSSFVNWKKTVTVYVNKRRAKQGILKKILFTVPLMHSDRSKMENGGTDWVRKEDGSPDKLRENKNFVILRSMVPSICKFDKEAVLNDTIKYVQELEARVEELESTIDNKEETVNDTVYDYGRRKIDNGKKPWLNKRKACDLDDGTDPEMSSGLATYDLKSDMKVSIIEQEVLIELKCSWREFLLLEIIDAINKLQLDAHCIQSSSHNGIFTLAVTSKFRGAVTSAGMIKQELLKVTR